MHLVAALVVAFTPGIRTPSGNISCFLNHRTLHCAIVQAAYRSRLQQLCTVHTTVDWHGFELSRTERGTPTCSGGILYESPPRYHTLAYGHVWRIGGISCTSRTTGLTCTAGAHGLFISRASWRGW